LFIAIIAIVHILKLKLALSVKNITKIFPKML